MVVEESGWNVDSAPAVDPEVQKSLLQKLDAFERKQKEKEVDEKRQERQQKIQQPTLFNPNASPTTKIGKARPLTKKEKEKRVKAAQKAEEFAEQLASKTAKSAQKHVRPIRTATPKIWYF
jgi:hypothetical protein